MKMKRYAIGMYTIYMHKHQWHIRKLGTMIPRTATNFEDARKIARTLDALTKMEGMKMTNEKNVEDTIREEKPMTKDAKIEWIRMHKPEIIAAYADMYGSKNSIAIIWDDLDNIHIEAEPLYSADADLIYEGREMDPLYCRVMDDIYDADEWLKYTGDPITTMSLCEDYADVRTWDEYRSLLEEDSVPNPLEISKEEGEEYDILQADIIKNMQIAERQMIEQVSDDIIGYIIDNIVRKEGV